MLGFLICAFLAASTNAYWQKEMENEGYWEGDIELTPEQQALMTMGAHPFGSITYGRWPKGIVPYQIERSIGSGGRRAIADAIADYHKYTCLLFRKKERTDRNYISFYKGSGCLSPVGMVRSGANRVSLATNCWNKGTTMHEIGHSIGLHHEQGRSDRDRYVKIHLENVANQQWAYAFSKKKNINSLGTPYDLKSMMHYSSTAFAKRGLKTITTIDRSKQSLIDTYNRISGFSKIDIQQIGLMYKVECAKRGGANTTPRPGNCTDKSKNCTSWKTSGYCVNARYVRYMRTNCAKTCNFC